jgi:hypothetical protein
MLVKKISRPVLEHTHHPVEWVPEALSPGVKQPKREADHSPLCSAEVKNEWHCVSTSPMSSWRARRLLSLPVQFIVFPASAASSVTGSSVLVRLVTLAVPAQHGTARFNVLTHVFTVTL